MSDLQHQSTAAPSSVKGETERESPSSEGARAASVPVQRRAHEAPPVQKLLSVDAGQSVSAWGLARAPLQMKKNVVYALVVWVDLDGFHCAAHSPIVIA